MATARRFPQVQPSPQRGAKGESSADNAQPIGRLLVSAGVVTKEVVDAALAVQRKTFRPLGRILREEHGVSPEALAEALRRQKHVPRVFLRFFPIEVQTLRLLDRKLCAEQEIVAFERLGDLLCVALSNPSRRELIQQLRTQTTFEIAPFRAPWEDIQKVLKDHA
jgi:type IV pilus assembly protein PilB